MDSNCTESRCKFRWCQTGYYLFVLVNIVSACAWAAQNKPVIIVADDPPKLQGKKTTEVKPPPPPPPASGPASGVYLFDGKELSKDWKLVNEDAAKWEMQPKRKSIMIETQTSGCLDLKTAKNLLVLNKQLPTDDFEVIVKASFQAQAGAGNEIAMILSSDPANYFLMLPGHAFWREMPC